MSVLAAVRPDSWNFPLLLHVLGAMVLVGGVVAAFAAQLAGWRRDDPPGAALYARLAFRALLLVALPAWFVMRIGGQWVYSREGLDGAESDPTWLGIGFTTADGGGVLLLVSIVLAWLAARRLSRSGEGGSVPGRIAAVLTAILLAALLVTVWAMTAKPS